MTTPNARLDEDRGLDGGPRLDEGRGTDTAGMDAVWHVFDPNNLDAGGHLLVRDEQDVDRLVVALARPDASAALITHRGRPCVVFDGDRLPDHQVTVAVNGPYGYLTWSDEEHPYLVSDGDAGSPAFLAHYTEYDAGTGVDLATFRAALVEFLATGRRPTCLAWGEVT
jgi:hypothetical protein